MNHINFVSKLFEDFKSGKLSRKDLKDIALHLEKHEKIELLNLLQNDSNSEETKINEQEGPMQSLDGELTHLLDKIHDDLFYTLPGEFQEHDLGVQVSLYRELKSMLDAYPASKSLPGVKQILDRMEYDLSGLEGFNERLSDLFYILTGRWEFSPEARRK